MTEKIISSNSEEIPKTKLALQEKYDAMDKKADEAYERLKTKESTKLPKPTGWRMIVLPFKMPEKTKGGLYFGQETLEKQQVASTCGLVLAQGPHCYDKEKFPEGPWCKVGDWVIFARYAGSRIQIDGGEVRILNDINIGVNYARRRKNCRHRYIWSRCRG
jgi:co-chaperonin GroES (HSP10)